MTTANVQAEIVLTKKIAEDVLAGATECEVDLFFDEPAAGFLSDIVESLAALCVIPIDTF